MVGKQSNPSTFVFAGKGRIFFSDTNNIAIFAASFQACTLVKHTKLLAFVAILALLVVSCDQPEPEPEPVKVTVSVSPTSVEFTMDGGSSSLSVTSNGAWYARTDASWLKLSATSGSGNTTLTLTAPSNNGDARTGSVILESSDGKATVS